MSDEAKTSSLMALALHYPKSKRTDREQALWLSDYLSDLRPFSPEAVEFACRAWRLTAAKAFPKVGELIPMASRQDDANTPRRRFEEWRELSDDEYADLKLSEKIRHHQILAAKAFAKAGPQTLNKWPQRAEDMSTHWHHWRAVGRGHLAEAKSLREKMAAAVERNAA